MHSQQAAADIKLGCAVDSLEGWKAWQRDLDMFEHWAIFNTTKFNKGKCWVLHLGWSNAGHRNKLRDKWLESSSAERGLGVLVAAGSAVTLISPLKYC